VYKKELFNRMNQNLHRTYYRTLRYAVRVGTVAIIGLNTLPHMFPQKTVETNFQMPCNEKPIPKRYTDILNETCTKYKIDPDSVSLFYTNSFSTVSAGTTFLPNKSVIGLPRNYIFESVNDIVVSNIRFQDKPIDWESNIGKALQEVLLPNEDHIKFLIGHELTHIKDLHFIINTTHASMVCYATYKLGTMLFQNQVRFSRLALAHTLFFTCGVVLYKISKKYLNYYLEHEADEKSAQLGVSYCDGGIDYMRTRLKLNRILRKMHGEEGETMFSQIGNNLKDVSTHPKRTDRLKKLKEIKNLQTNE